MAKFSLIIPVYNEAPYLKRCLSSIPETVDLDVILIDDASTDGSAQIIRAEQVTELYRRAWFNQINQGVSACRNKGLEEANGEYIIFMDADDEWTPDAFKQINEATKEHPEAPVIQLNHYMEHANGSRTVRMYNAPGTYHLRDLPKLWVSSVNKIYKSDFIKDARFLEGLQHGEDELFNLEVLKKARQIVCVDRIALIHHKDNPGSLSKTTTASDLFNEQLALTSFLNRHTEDADLCEAVRKRQTELWDNAVYKKIYGGEK